jgi:expansin
MTAGLVVVLGVTALVATARRPDDSGDSLVAAALEQAPPATASTTPTAPPLRQKPPTRKKPQKRNQPQKRKKPGTHGMQPKHRPAAAKGSGRIRFGTTYRGRATFYDADGGGNCSYPPSGDLMVGAMNQRDYANSQACGAYLAVTGPRGNTITIRVVDRCPECPPGAIDLSAQAFAKLADPSAGRISIRWRLVGPTLKGPVSYVYKTGSSRYWCGIQVRNHRNPVRSLAVLVNGTWKSLPRFDYNYFLSETGAGCGSRIRVTDIVGHQLTDSGIRVLPGQVQKGHVQFPAR